MSEVLLSVGLDVGTTSTQLVVSELVLENRAGGFSVPELTIVGRRIRWCSPVHLTPLIGQALVDAAALREIVDASYRDAGITQADVDTGAIIITGETGRKENARAVLAALSDYAGDFVVATAGPDLESVLAAKGAGAVEFSEKTGKTVLHIDIGGGTSNLALIENGQITATGCLNVGGRLLKIGKDGRLTYVSPVLGGLFSGEIGDPVHEEDVRALAETLARALEMAASLREKTPLFRQLLTQGAETVGVCPPGTVISFSGGVADCIETEHPYLAFGDIGPELGRAIRESRLCAGAYMLGRETIRATVIGAGSHSAQLSGSTVYHQNVALPLKNLPVTALPDADADGIRRALARFDTDVVLAIPGIPSPGYGEVAHMAETIAAGCRGTAVLVALEADMARALGQQLALRLGQDAKILCIDRVRLRDGDYLDVGAPVGPALPVVIKTLILGSE